MKARAASARRTWEGAARRPAQAALVATAVRHVYPAENSHAPKRAVQAPERSLPGLRAAGSGWRAADTGRRVPGGGHPGGTQGGAHGAPSTPAAFFPRKNKRSRKPSVMLHDLLGLIF